MNGGGHGGRWPPFAGQPCGPPSNRAGPPRWPSQRASPLAADTKPATGRAEVGAHGVLGRDAKGHHPLGPSLADNPHPVCTLDITDGHPGNLRDTQPGCVEHLEKRPIAQSHRVIAIDLLQHLTHGPLRESVGQRGGTLWPGDLVRRVYGAVRHGEWRRRRRRAPPRPCGRSSGGRTASCRGEPGSVERAADRCRRATPRPIGRRRRGIAPGRPGRRRPCAPTAAGGAAPCRDMPPPRAQPTAG